MKPSQELTDKQAEFVKLVNNGLTTTNAYKQAGYATKNENSVNAAVSRLLRVNNVSAAIQRHNAQQLRKDTRIAAKVEERVAIDQGWLIDQLITTINDARKVNQFNVVRNSIVDIGKLCGLYVDKREVNAQLSIDAQLTQLDTSTLIQALTEARHPPAIEAEFHEVAEE